MVVWQWTAANVSDSVERFRPAARCLYHMVHLQRTYFSRCFLLRDHFFSKLEREKISNGENTKRSCPPRFASVLGSKKCWFAWRNTTKPTNKKEKDWLPFSFACSVFCFLFFYARRLRADRSEQREEKSSKLCVCIGRVWSFFGKETYSPFWAKER
jgi:hypothetical protein